jgi:hypothetical protein
MHDDELRDLRRELATYDRGPGVYYAEQLRDRVAAWTRRRRAEGATWPELVGAIGLRAATLRAWSEGRRAGAKASVAMVPVEVVSTTGSAPSSTEPAMTRIALVSPRGFRIEWLTLDEALAALARLG